MKQSRRVVAGLLLSIPVMQQSAQLLISSCGVVDGFVVPPVVLNPRHGVHPFHPIMTAGPFLQKPTPTTSSTAIEASTAAAAVTITSSLPSEITTKALAQIYPAMVQHKAEYGNPNIPLGSAEGRQCNIIRNMHIQGKLSEPEVELLKEIGFIFLALEDVYERVDFDELLARLVAIKASNDGDADIPKKYAPDPELGAWVTGIRRLGPEGVSCDHCQRLEEIGFVWVSPRKCGSKFMAQYRDIVQRLDDGEDNATILEEEQVKKFVRAQKEAYKRKTLSETRIEYMTRVAGGEWWI